MIHYLTSDSLMIPNEQLLVALSQFGHGLLPNEDPIRHTEEAYSKIGRTRVR